MTSRIDVPSDRMFIPHRAKHGHLYLFGVLDVARSRQDTALTCIIDSGATHLILPYRVWEPKEDTPHCEITEDTPSLQPGMLVRDEACWVASVGGNCWTYKKGRVNLFLWDFDKDGAWAKHEGCEARLLDQVVEVGLLEKEKIIRAIRPPSEAELSSFRTPLIGYNPLLKDSLLLQCVLEKEDNRLLIMDDEYVKAAWSRIRA